MTNNDDIIFGVVCTIGVITTVWAFTNLYNERANQAKLVKEKRDEDIAFCQGLKAPEDKTACLARLAAERL